MSDCNRSYRVTFANVLRAIAAASVFIIMTAIYRQDDDPGSNYLHPRRAMQ